MLGKSMNRLAINVIVAFILLLMIGLMLWSGKSAQPEQPVPAPAPAQSAEPKVHDISVHGETIVIPTPESAGISRVSLNAESGRLDRICFTSAKPERALFFLVREIPVAEAMTVEEFDQWKVERMDGFFGPEELRQEEKPPRLVDPEGEPIPLSADEIYVQQDDRAFLTTETPVRGGGLAGHIIVTRMLLREFPIAICVMSLAKDGEAEDPLPLTLAWREAIIEANPE